MKLEQLQQRELLELNLGRDVAQNLNTLILPCPKAKSSTICATGGVGVVVRVKDLNPSGHHWHCPGTTLGYTAIGVVTHHDLQTHAGTNSRSGEGNVGVKMLTKERWSRT
jgi:hypothetical protein